ncbi:MucR family transcriptional regulator [Methylobacterium mesophilicum SR1.6/6]|uniref:MucR family transcriptional regulator n=2 Tax=Methylobacterium mesophilicum TaxID=39956 RepID=A0A6B9FYZ6_9HYPH|nr:MucR family transcriptional regulator [Methylobacterium mesophilicum]QGY06236.1 MucR family transcriptional regulator [Methylobacterium mesophilicum SR1.6/6]
MVEAVAVDYVQITADVVSAYVSKNSVRPADMAELIASTHAALAGLGNGVASAAPAAEKLTPAQIRKSIRPDALVSFIDGKPYKTLKRHLAGNGLTMEEYRARFGLPRDYPSTAASYSALRSEMAHRNGLGQLRKKVAPKAAAPAEIISEKPKRAGRPRKAKDGAEA